jgi:hypothetical protein
LPLICWSPPTAFISFKMGFNSEFFLDGFEHQLLSYPSLFKVA